MALALGLAACGTAPTRSSGYAGAPSPSTTHPPQVNTAPLTSETAPSAVEVSVPTVVESTTTAAAEPFVSPLGAGKGKILSHFGSRHVPNDPTKMEPHEGVDFRVTPGEPVRVAKSGKVLFAGFSKSYVSRKDKNDQAHLIIVQHADGMSTRYVHLNVIKVRPMQQVKAGDVLGTAIESDEWSEPVLHFEIRNMAGKAVNPEDYLAKPKHP